MEINYTPVNQIETKQTDRLTNFRKTINSVGIVARPGLIESYNFVSGSAGWKLTAAGNIEASNGTFRGTITATTGAIGGWTIGASSLTAGSGATTVGLDSTVTAGDDVRIYAGSATLASAPFRVTEAGAVTMTNLTVVGTAGSITGALIHTASSGSRVVFDGQGATKKFYVVDDNSNEVVTIYANGSVHGILVNKASNSNIENCLRLTDAKNENDNGTDNGLAFLNYTPSSASTKPLLRMNGNASFNGQYLTINGLGTHTGVGQQMIDISAVTDDRVIVIGSFAGWNVRGDGRQTVKWLGIGATVQTNASVALEIGNATQAILLNSVTTTQRDALTAVNGMLVYNSTLNKFQGYESGSWQSLI